MSKSTKPKTRDVVLPHYSYQPSRKELRDDPRVDATFEEVAAACLKPVKITYATLPRKTPKRKRR